MSYNANALCQAALLEGVSKGNESRIESRIRHLVEHNGPEFAIDTLKKLKEHSIAQLDEPNKAYRNVQGDVQVAWNTRRNSPKGELGLLYKQFPKPASRIRVIGALISSISLDTLSHRQIDRFTSGLLSRRRKDQDAMPGVVTRPLQKQLNNRIRHYWKVKEPFSVSELSATAIPVGTYNDYVGGYKRDLADRSNSERFTRAVAELDKATVNQFYTAPPSARTAWNELSKSVGRSDLGIPNKIHMTPILSRPYQELRVPGQVNLVPVYQPYVGTIGMLQQAGAKLRSVVNVNRFVNSVLDPYAKAIEDVYYQVPGISVLDQESGLRWAQGKLRDGIHLTSMDLSQATDLLDFRVITDSFEESEFKELALSASFFREMAESPFFVPELGGSIHFATGQPLGMKGSFQTLTLMNWSAGVIASAAAGLDPDDSFRVVGDDMVCDTRMATAYNAVIQSWGGKTNQEKALASSNYAEFLSHIVTKNNILKTKPKYSPGRESIMANAEKSTVGRMQHVYRLSKSDQLSLSIISEYSDFENSNIPYIRGPVRKDKETRDLMSMTLAIFAKRTDTLPKTEIVKRDSIEYSHREHDVYANESRETDRRIYTRSDDGPVFQEPSRGVVHLDKGEFSPVVDRFDHHANKRVAVNPDRGANNENTRKVGSFIRAIRDDLENARSSKIKLPYNQSVDTTELLVEAFDAEKTIKSTDNAHTEKVYGDPAGLHTTIRKRRKKIVVSEPESQHEQTDEETKEEIPMLNFDGLDSSGPTL